jgi:hypothetical protein
MSINAAVPPAALSKRTQTTVRVNNLVNANQNVGGNARGADRSTPPAVPDKAPNESILSILDDIEKISCDLRIVAVNTGLGPVILPAPVRLGKEGWSGQ